MITLLFLLACAGKPVPPPPTAAPAPEASPAAAPAAAPAAERRTVTLDPSEMSWDEAAGKAIFSPGSRVMAADYTTWELDLASVEATLGGRPQAPVAVVVEVSGVETSNYKPEDPNLPQPMGGFTYTTIRGRVVAKAP